jgi:hypothetical protein
MESCNLKKTLDQSQSTQRTLKTSILILLGMLVDTSRQNKDLIEQKNILSSLCSRLFSSKNQLELILNEHFLNNKQENKNIAEKKQLSETNLKPLAKGSNSKDLNNETFELVDAVDYSVSCSMLSASSSRLSKNDSFNFQLVKSKYKKTHLFRQVAIAILATNRLIYLVNMNRNMKFSMIESNKRYSFRLLSSQNSDKSYDFKTCIRAQQQEKKSCRFSNEEVVAKSFFDWFSDSKEIREFDQITETAEEINKLIFFENGNDFSL